MKMGNVTEEERKNLQQLDDVLKDIAMRSSDFISDEVRKLNLTDREKSVATYIIVGNLKDSFERTILKVGIDRY